MKRQELIDQIVDLLSLHQDDVIIVKASDNGTVVIKITALELDDADESVEKEADDEDEDDEDEIPEAEFDDTKLEDDE